MIVLYKNLTQKINQVWIFVFRDVVYAKVEEVRFSAAAVTQRPSGSPPNLPVQTQPKTRSGSKKSGHVTFVIEIRSFYTGH